MSEVIDLNQKRNERDRPAPEFIMHDDFGREMQTYLLSYQINGKTWGGVQVWAYSQEDAEARVAAMRESITCLGQCFEVIVG